MATWHFNRMICRSRRRHAYAAGLVTKALAMPLPRLVLAKPGGVNRLLLSRGTYGLPYRITFFDERGPRGHLEFRASDRGDSFASMDTEIAHALAGGYRPEKRRD